MVAILKQGMKIIKEIIGTLNVCMGGKSKWHRGTRWMNAWRVIFYRVYKILQVWHSLYRTVLRAILYTEWNPSYTEGNVSFAIDFSEARVLSIRTSMCIRACKQSIFPEYLWPHFCMSLNCQCIIFTRSLWSREALLFPFYCKGTEALWQKWLLTRRL